MLGQGVGFKAIQEILGHTDTRTTMNLYAHLFPDAKREAAERMDTILNPVVTVPDSRKAHWGAKFFVLLELAEGFEPPTL